MVGGAGGVPPQLNPRERFPGLALEPVGQDQKRPECFRDTLTLWLPGGIRRPSPHLRGSGGAQGSDALIVGTKGLASHP